MKVKGEIPTVTGHGGPQEEQRWNCTLSLTLTLDGVVGQRHATAALPPQKRTGNHCTGGCVAQECADG